LTISGEKKFSEPGKKQLLNAHLHSLASNHCDNSREAKKTKKKTITQKHKICAEIRYREKSEREEEK
jgi:hypothetical protein